MIFCLHRNGESILCEAGSVPGNSTASPVEITQTLYRLDRTPLIGDELEPVWIPNQNKNQTEAIKEWLRNEANA